VTIGIFITPGAHGTEHVEIGGANPNNRAAEYDALGDRYARFLIDDPARHTALDLDGLSPSEALNIQHLVPL